MAKEEQTMIKWGVCIALVLTGHWIIAIVVALAWKRT
jgi:hypothetical protein